MYSFHLPENPTPDQVRKVLAMIGHVAGGNVMREVTASFGAAAEALKPTPVMVNGHDESERMPLTHAALNADRVPPPPLQVAPVAVELDATNMPWDARIHAATKTRNKEGSWKAKKNLDETTKMQVVSELRALHPAKPVESAPAPLAKAPPPPPLQAPELPLDAPGGDASTFARVMMKTSGMLNEGKISKEQIATVCNSLGVPNTIGLANRSDLWPAYCANLDAYAVAA